MACDLCFVKLIFCGPISVYLNVRGWWWKSNSETRLWGENKHWAHAYFLGTYSWSPCLPWWGIVLLLFAVTEARKDPLSVIFHFRGAQRCVIKNSRLSVAQESLHHILRILILRFASLVVKRSVQAVLWLRSPSTSKKANSTACRAS